MIIRRRYLLEHTPCKTPIETDEQGTFYAADSETPITVCPGCGAVLERADVDMSADTKRRLAAVFRLILSYKPPDETQP